MNEAQHIATGHVVFGCELGSTRIKSTLITPCGKPLGSGAFGWENQLDDGIWTYDMDAVLKGLATSYAALAEDVRKSHGMPLERIGALGFSAMMHGYIATDAAGELLVPFRTWRNNFTGEASSALTDLFGWPIPQRWSIAHLYHAITSGEAHVGDIAHITTLAGWVHWKLTGQWAIGVGDASGMFPVDPKTGQWDAWMLETFDAHVADRGLGWSLADILPTIVKVGEDAGTLTEPGAALLDTSGALQAGAVMAPPEGDAQTGMVVTNSVRPRTGNVSAGTSVFAMLVLEERLSSVHHEIDLVLTPDGELVGMAHSNNCSSDFDAWAGLLGEAAALLGADVDDDKLFSKLMPMALQADADAGGLLAYGYVSGEHMTGFSEGRPLFVRAQNSRFTLANFVRAHLFSALCALRTGMNVLTEREGVKVEELRGHGGFFKTEGVGQRMMAAATNTPVSLPDTAGEGGAWGMALLAAYLLRDDRDQALADFLDRLIGDSIGPATAPDPADVAGFNDYFKRHTAALAVEAAAVEHVD
ncbi:ATPase [Marinihelvus fidelis]|uniref:ATPase n=1 Tax=Marinihelvus fidelis TaxID=2613842 RepID=A0A5N0T9M1_9GAMM|nr:FGGY-family carbohydrate kinase [Marinihelvus fidelis]KAA9130506.1 ATPase [Marinihelvus fidelis]